MNFWNAGPHQISYDRLPGLPDHETLSMQKAHMKFPPDRLRRRDLLLAGAAFGVGPSRAQQPAAGPRLDRDRLLQLQARLAANPHVRAFLIERGDDGYSYYRADTQPATALNIASVTKSVVALLVGAAIGRGHLQDVNEPLASFFPEHAGGPHAANLSRVTLAHLLSLASGFDHQGLNELTDYTDFQQRFHAPGLMQHALSRQLTEAPGRRFYYSNLDAHLVTLALARRLPVPVHDFARDVLFAPLGITAFTWPTGHDGGVNGAAELRLSAPDLLRIGRLVRQQGQWQGRQLIPAAYLQAATRRQVGTDLPPRGRADLWGYGYLWWLASTPGDDLPAYYAAGYGGQFLYVVPDLQLVIAAITEQVSREVAGRTAALIRDIALPAVR